jgi:hypothetical protein
MGFYEILDQVVDLLRRRGRVTYRALQREFQLDEDTLTDLKDELLYAHPEARDDAGRGLVWSSPPDTASPVASPPASPQDRAPLAYTPAHLAEQILAARSTLEGERKPVIDLLRRYCAVDDRDDTRSVRAKVTGQALTLDAAGGPAGRQSLPRTRSAPAPSA